ncbi:MAG: amidohydrolase family protein [Anaerolineae bacterium]
MSTIKDRWSAGQGLPDCLVIDGHVHYGDWPHAATYVSVEEAVENSVRVMDANGIDAVCAVSGGYIFGLGDYHLGNDYLLKIWRRLPERVIPLMGINPNDTRGHVLAELERMYQAGIRGIKLINAYQNNYPGDGPNLMALYTYAAEHSMLVFNHSWSEQEIRNIAGQFPGTDFVFGHYGGGFQDTVLSLFPNVYTNIWSYGALGWLERGIARVGAHKFMLGSDAFLNAPSVGIGPVVFAGIDDADKRLILGLTAARLLAKVGALPKALELSSTGRRLAL